MALLFFLVEEQKTPKRIVGRGGESFEVPGGAISVPNWTPLGDPIRQPGGGQPGGARGAQEPQGGPIRAPETPVYKWGSQGPPLATPQISFLYRGGAF